MTTGCLIAEGLGALGFLGLGGGLRRAGVGGRPEDIGRIDRWARAGICLPASQVDSGVDGRAKWKSTRASRASARLLSRSHVFCRSEKPVQDTR
jgi:hypothetical protein